MQIDQIRITDVIKQDNTREIEGLFSGGTTAAAKEEKPQELRTIRMDNPFYNKNFLQQDTVADQLQQQLDQGTTAQTMHNEMAVYSQTTSDEDYQKMEEEGFSPMDMDAPTIVTVTDRIKVALAKGGADISRMGGISDEALSELSDGQLQENQIREAMSGRDLPLQEDAVSAAQAAEVKLEQLPDSLSADSVQYLMSRDLEPTIENIYQATYATGSSEYKDGTQDTMSAELTEPLPEDLQQQLSQVIADAGLETGEDTLGDCQWMMDHEIPVTADNLLYLNQLRDLKMDYTSQERVQIITDALAQGKDPQDSNLVPEQDLMTRARELMDYVWDDATMESLQDVQAKRSLEEARMIMSVQANYSLLKQGISIDIMSIQDVVDQLKQQEEAWQKQLLTGTTPEETQQNWDLYQQVNEKMSSLAQAPAVVLGKIPDVAQVSIEDVLDQAKPMADAFEKANQRYETMQTEVRTDLGDSMEKAFGNVDDILQDLNMEQSDENRRAVRILAYNEMELTQDNIVRIKAQDMQVQKLFRSMKPAVVTEMIKSGENPLDKSIGELNDLAQDFQQQNSGSDQEEQYAKFLWKAEHTGELTPEQRESYIGVYRLIYQVEQQDGAPIGALIAQGADVTLRNLMTAVRSSRHTGKEYTIDDDFGEVESFRKDSLSITEQIEMGYQRDCLREAGEEMTPGKMAHFNKEEEYMDMTPEKFRDSLQEMDDLPEVARQDETLQQAYQGQAAERVRNALASEEQVYEVLEENDIPTTPAYLEGMQQWLANPNQTYRKLNGYAALQETAAQPEISSGQSPDEVAVSELIQKVIQDFGEALQTPEEMAEAQRKLADTAENAMKNVLVEQDVTSIDVRGMKLITTQIKALGQIAEHNETYEIPILVEDKVGNLSLKIVRGQDKKGLVDVAFNMEETGAVHSSFRYENGAVTGDLSFEKQETEQQFLDHAQEICETMEKQVELPVSFRFSLDPKESGEYARKMVTADRSWEDSVVSGFKDGFEETTDRDPVSTKVLYGVARSFIGALSSQAYR